MLCRTFDIWGLSILPYASRQADEAHEAKERVFDEFRKVQVAFELDNATAADALDAITAVTHKPWTVFLARPLEGRKGGTVILVIEAEPY